jgi:hypothetical protein
VRVAVLLLLFSGAAFAGGGKFAAAPAPSSASNGFTRGGGQQPDPRKAGPLDPKRKVNEQDCSKPVDLAAGNLKCK